MTDRRLIPALLAMITLVFGLFTLVPELDLAITALFYDGTGFPIGSMVWVETARQITWDMTIATALLAAGLMLATGLLRRPLLGLGLRAWGLIVLVFVLGPGLLVNGLLKRYSGRARPADVTQFGGTQAFTPPGQLADQCSANCSFVSGEVAGSMAMTLALLLILRGLRGRMPPVAFHAAQGVAWLALAATMLQRIAAGRHFASDVLLAALFVALIAAILARLMLNRDSP